MPDQLGSPGLYSLSFWHLRLPPFLTAIRSQLSGLIVFSREVGLVGKLHPPHSRNLNRRKKRIRQFRRES